jgi:hypothetical protein
MLRTAQPCADPGRQRQPRTNKGPGGGKRPYRFQDRQGGGSTPGASAARTSPFAGTSRAERRRSRTYQRMGYMRLPVLKTGWATGPLPLQACIRAESCSADTRCVRRCRVDPEAEGVPDGDEGADDEREGRMNHAGHRTHHRDGGGAPAEAVVSGLTFPTGMTVGPNGAFYVSENGRLGSGAPPPQGRASKTRLNGVSATRLKRVKPPRSTTARICPSPACAPSASPTSCESDEGVQRNVEKP